MNPLIDHSARYAYFFRKVPHAVVKLDRFLNRSFAHGPSVSNASLTVKHCPKTRETETLAPMGKEIKARNEALGQRVKEAIESKPLSVAYIAKVCGVTPNAVYGWYKTGRIAKNNLLGVAKETGVSYSYLVDGEGRKNSESDQLGLTEVEMALVLHYREIIDFAVKNTKPEDALKIKESSRQKTQALLSLKPAARPSRKNSHEEGRTKEEVIKLLLRIIDERGLREVAGLLNDFVGQGEGEKQGAGPRSPNAPGGSKPTGHPYAKRT